MPSNRKRPSGDCPKCGTWRRSLHRDHIIPKFRGGPDTEDNCQYICANCHEDKTREDLTGIGRPGWPSEQTKRNISLANKGRQQPPGFGAKISAALSGVPKTAEHRAKIAAAHTGMTYNSEVKRKVSEAAKINHLKRERDVFGRFKGVKC